MSEHAEILDIIPGSTICDDKGSQHLVLAVDEKSEHFVRGTCLYGKETVLFLKSIAPIMLTIQETMRYQNGLLTACIKRANGTKLWFQNGKRHRTDGPAIEWADGGKEWWQNGERHRLDGPAAEWANGDKEWWQNGERHRTDGPAVEWANGYKWWFIEDIRYTEKDFSKKVKVV